LLVAWVLFLCFVPDPRPLGAPPWAVGAVRAVAGVDEPAGRLLATLALRAAGLALLGALLSVAMGAKRWDRRGAAALALAPLLAIATLWVNLGYFPIAQQLVIAAAAAATGAIARLALHRSPLTAVALAVALAGAFGWGVATGIGDELDGAARAVGRRLLDAAATVPDGDDGFVRLIELAFGSAEAGDGAADPVRANEAAILALAVILGDEQIASVASRDLDRDRLAEAKALRKRITLLGRKDWPRHFWVSAGLTLLSDADRSIAVGLSKELMDATPGGSGFSFADLAADAAGSRFTLAATRDDASARALQARLRAGFRIADHVPELRDLPEGISRQEFADRFGGLGGSETTRLVDEIRRRLERCAGLR
jgi:hypothetical protein